MTKNRMAIEAPQSINMAQAFMSMPEGQEEASEGLQKPSKTVKRAIAKKLELTAKRTKSRRVQVLLYPDVYEELKAQSETTDRSVNDLINLLLEQSLGLSK